MVNDMKELPKPTQDAKSITNITLAVASQFFPPLAILKEGFELLIDKRIEEGRQILVDEIIRNGINILTDKQIEHYIPSAYSFFKQVQIGEYQHNLRILARMISGEITMQEREPDATRVGRAARKLEMLPAEHLAALARCPRAFEIHKNSDKCDGYWIYIGELELQASFKEVSMNISPIKCQEYLHELAIRGILTSGGSPQHVGGIFYYKNTAFDEIISAVSSVEKEVSANLADKIFET